MASPQVDDGHFTRIHNEIMEALGRTRIPGEARQILDIIVRKTYGYQKKEDVISLSQFCLASGLNKVHVCRAIVTLKIMNMITQKGNEIANSYSFNKDFDTWKPLPKKVTLPKKVKTITQKGNLPLPKKVHTKEILTKERKKELFSFLWKQYPSKDGKKEALRHFMASVKTEQDSSDIQTALNNYLASEKVRKGFIKNGSTWFNNWQDWIDQPTSTVDVLGA
jgi:phage replication O-like protein O